MPTYAAVGPELPINGVTLYTQWRADFARLADGRFVAVWESNDGQQDASSSGIKGRVLGFDGLPVGPEFLINTATADSQTYASVAGLTGGGFVITWTSHDATQDGSYGAIKAQRFDANGAKLGGEFLVNTNGADTQWISSAAGLDSGGFVIVWETYDYRGDGSGRAIKGQRYDSAGVKLGGEFLVNTVTADHQMGAEISALSGGRFIVTCGIQIAGQLDVRAQVFDSAGAKIGGEIFVNSQTIESQVEQSVTNLANGGFVITWMTYDTSQDGSGTAIKAQVFDAAGAKIGGEVLINTAVSGGQREPSVAGLSNGDFVVAWRTDDQAADDLWGAIKAQVFSSTGQKLGGEFRVNSTGSSIESNPSVVDLGNGAFAIGWNSRTNQGYDENIKVQIFSSGSAPVIQSNGGGTTASIVMVEDATAVTTIRAIDIDGSGVRYTIAGGTDAAHFVIDPVSGALAFARAPDFDAPGDAGANNIYDLVVRASDGERADEQALSVRITAASHAVTIVSDGGGPAAALGVDEGNMVVTMVAAVDGDGGAITYSITGGADAACFIINSFGGLAFRSAPDREAPADIGADNVYDVIVQASDGELVDTQALSVTVRNVNEAPVIMSGIWPHGSSVMGGFPEGWVHLEQLGAVDPDGDAIAWTLSGQDASRFAYDPATSRLNFKTPLDYEAWGSAQGTNTYRFTLSVDDGALTDSIDFTVFLTNVNEPVVITSLASADAATIAVDENIAIATTVAAIDLDGYAPTYRISGGSDAALFTMNATTGALAFLTAPDHEAPTDAGQDGVYSVIVSATDGSFTDSQAIDIVVANVNEAVTIISFGGSDAGAISVAENVRAVTFIAARDGDGDPVRYSIAGGADAADFAIDAVTGALSFVATPDHEMPSDADGDNVYAVLVRADDGALADLLSLSVTVANVRDGVTIVGNGSANTISTVAGIAGQPFATKGEDVIFGMGGSDTLVGGAGDDRIEGGAGGDRIAGGLGSDVLLGGIGMDRFAYGSVADSRGGAIDTILDFAPGQDLIDLRMIDARTTLAGDQAFAFIGESAFGHVAGQLRYERIEDDILVRGDTNGDAIADFAIRVEWLTSLSIGDFIL